MEPYIKLGRRLKAVIQKLGYPTKNLLKAWHEIFQKSGDVQANYVRRKQKYSDEQKIVTIDHYINHGRCFAFTRKALAYPGLHTIKQWIYERYPEIKRCVVSKAVRPAASLASKRAAVYELSTREGSAQVVAQRMDVDRVTLYNWKNQLLGRETPASIKRNKQQPTQADVSDLERQVESLQHDIRNLQLEHDLLKKASELIKEDLGVNLQLLSDRRRFTFVTRNGRSFHPLDGIAGHRIGFTEILEQGGRAASFRRIVAPASARSSRSRRHASR